MTAVIIDDEYGNISFLSGLLHSYCPKVQVVAEAQNIQEGLTVLKERKPDILFLDIQMPRGNGFDLLDQLDDRNENLQVIFTTAYDQYAVRAFQYSAQDYLLKPIHPKQLVQCVDRASKEKEKLDQLERIKHIHLLYSKKEEAISSVIIRSLSGQIKIQIDDIIRCEADGNYTIFKIKEQSSIIATKSLKEYDILLRPFGFLRIHQSHLIHRNFFVKYIPNKDAGGGHVLLSNGDKIPVSRSKKKMLLHSMQKQTWQ